MTTETLNKKQETAQFVLEPTNNLQLRRLAGPVNAHIKQVEKDLAVQIGVRGNVCQIEGDELNVTIAKSVINTMYEMVSAGEISNEQIHLLLREHSTAIKNQRTPPSDRDEDEVVIPTRRGNVRGRGPNQKGYLKLINENTLTFGVGPAGTGKTYLAVACAVRALEQDEVRKVILTRPAVEAGENLGFLPGDLTQKIDPYLRPLYDALHEMLGVDRVTRLIERQTIEIAPLAFMRGRTLNEAFVILDEAQNTTTEQMKMFLTRIGYGSKAVVTGDVSQIDLPRHQLSGLKHSLDVLEGVEGIGVTRFGSRDVVRHPLVQRIVEAYDRHEEEHPDGHRRPTRQYKDTSVDES